MSQTVKKAVLPVAGLGTRFLPATKAMPKEMLTVVDKPVIQYAVEEALAAGIEEFIFITGRDKSAIENHFDRPYELADMLEKRGKTKELDAVLNILPDHVRCYYTRQGQPKGLGHAIGCARGIVGDEPFAVVLPDDIIQSKQNTLGEMIKTYEDTGKSVVLTQEVPLMRTKNYGILDVAGKEVENQRVPVSGFVEKPGPDKAPSLLGITGRYVLSPKIFDLIEKEDPGYGGEIQLTDAMHTLAQQEGFYGYVLDGQRFDCGDKVGFQKPNLFFALQDPYIGERLRIFIEETLADESLRPSKSA